MTLNNEQQKKTVVQLEITLERLELLFNKGLLCAVDVSPLNSESKACIWDLCLSSCVKKLQCKLVLFDHARVESARVEPGRIEHANIDQAQVGQVSDDGVSANLNAVKSEDSMRV